jgi:MoxR-like ATPase
MSEPNPFLQFQGTDGYIAGPALVDAVNAAIALERPLLVKGEPGTGKTLLAQHVAEGLSMPATATSRTSATTSSWAPWAGSSPPRIATSC